MTGSEEQIYGIQKVREHETTIKAKQDGLMRLCWRTLDRKSKKLNFNFQISEAGNHNQLAGQDTLEVLNVELA